MTHERGAWAVVVDLDPLRAPAGSVISARHSGSPRRMAAAPGLAEIARRDRRGFTPAGHMTLNAASTSETGVRLEKEWIAGPDWVLSRISISSVAWL